MDEFKLISASDDYQFNIKLIESVKQGWIPYGELCSNVAVARSEYSTAIEKYFSMIMIRKQGKKEN